MTKEKVFPLKVDSGGNGALKESVNKHTSDDQTKLKVVYALDSELRLVEPLLFENDIFLDVSSLASQNSLSVQDFLLECKKDGKPIFFSLSSLTYICVHTIVKERNNIVKNSISLYVPKGLKKSGLVCNDVSVMFPRQNRNVLANNLMTYSVSRV